MMLSTAHALARPRAALATLFAAAACSALAAPEALAHDLTVVVNGAAPDKGSVFAAVYAENGWGRDGQPLQGAVARVEAGGAVLVYRGLCAGRYAVKAFQDENGNGRLDTNPAGRPLERIGFSRDARGRMGPPAFGDAAIDLQQDTTFTLQLR